MGVRDQTKICATCGRVIEWRKKWAEDWEHVKYCSERCRRHKPGERDRALERAILEALEARPGRATVTPAQIAGRVGLSADLEERVRMAARRLVAAGRVELVQGGRRVDPSTARGSVQIRLV